MRRVILLFALLLASVGVFAQGDTPGALVGLLEAGDFQALTVTDDERYLLVADAATNQIRVYELSNLADPPLVGSVSVEGIPTGIASGRGFALVSTRSSFSPSTVEILAPARYSSDGLFTAGSNFVDLPFETHSVVVSRERDYAAAFGNDRFALLRLRSADEIDARTFNQSTSAAAISSGVMYFAEGETLFSSQLDGTTTPESLASVAAGGTVVAIAISPDGELGALALSNDTLALFDPSSLAILTTTRIAGTPSIIQFGVSEGALRLIAAARGQGDFLVFDVTDPATIQPLDAEFSLSGSITALTTFADYVVATDGSTIGIFALP